MELDANCRQSNAGRLALYHLVGYIHYGDQRSVHQIHLNVSYIHIEDVVQYS